MQASQNKATVERPFRENRRDSGFSMQENPLEIDPVKAYIGLNLDSQQGRREHEDKSLKGAA